MADVTPPRPLSEGDERNHLPPTPGEIPQLRCSRLEIGVFSGGSLRMWREYFGAKALVYGVDIESACCIYKNEFTRIFIGDQGDRQFWRMFKAKVPQIDVVIDDGSHIPSDQITTFKELFPAVTPGGV